MSEKVSRRALIEVVGGAAIGLTACGSKSPPQPDDPMRTSTTPFTNRVNLICYGMLGFWCDTAAKMIKILIPHSPPMAVGRGDAHVVWLSEFIGGQPSRLDTSVATDYSLDLGDPKNITPDPKTPFINTKELWGSNLVLFDSKNQTNHNLQPGSIGANPGVLATITLPFPTKVRPFRIMKYAGLPYYANDTAKSFGLSDQNLNQLSSVNVLTYDFNGITPGMGPVVTLTPKGGTSWTFQRNIAPNILNLHLYSQPAVQKGYEGDHIPYFNALFTYKHMDTSVGVLDLKSAVGSGMAPANGTLDDDLSGMDVESLTELPWSPPATRLSDPAECVQGWGS
jgi:hypothetical protein